MDIYFIKKTLCMFMCEKFEIYHNDDVLEFFNEILFASKAFEMNALNRHASCLLLIIKCLV